MAFIQVSTNGGGSESRLPIFKYKANAGRFIKINRIQTPDGWVSNDVDVTMDNPPFAVDFGSIEAGWILFPPSGAPFFVLVPYGEPMPLKPSSPASDEKGVALQFKQGFRVKVAGQKIDGVREFTGNSMALISGMNLLHDQFEAAAEAQAGKIPVVQIERMEERKSGQSTNYMPIFKIVAWVERPAALGARTVAPPQPRSRMAQQPVVNGHVPPPTPVVAAPAAAALAPVSDEAALSDEDMPF